MRLRVSNAGREDGAVPGSLVQSCSQLGIFGSRPVVVCENPVQTDA